jgi:phosphatidylglycerol:prolipoprotein diacylglycerol transferase
MRPVFFRWRGIKVHSYPAMQYIGLVLGVFAGNAAAHASHLDAFRVFVATFMLIVPALAGARLLFVVAHWDIFRNDIPRIWNPRDGGAAQYGGLLLAVPLSVPLLSALHLPFGAFWDIGIITILVGMIFTRIGCLMNGCCTGRASRVWWSMYLPGRDGKWEKRLPTQILEAGLAFVLLVAGLLIWKSLPFNGALFIFVTGGYACGRLLTESLREHARVEQRFTLHHAISLALIAASLAALTVHVPR